VNYAEINTCRRASLLGYFGEHYPSDNCGRCDNCLAPRETYDGTVEAQKLLSCVYRIREKSGFDLGLNHTVEVLCGANTEKIRRFNHHTLSTYGIGTGHDRAVWAAIGRELIRLGYLRQRATDKFTVVELTPEGRDALIKRKPFTLTRPLTAPQAKHKPAPTTETDGSYDQELFERLRRLRKQIADERSVPPYIVFSDVSLRHMASLLPCNRTDFLRVNGVGEKKLQEFGTAFISEIVDYLSGDKSV
jgi:ATP-dependent DNA helicase RecQ